MKIGFISASDPFYDRKAWSGLIYKLREAIELAGFEVVWIPYDPLYKINSLKTKLYGYYWYIRGRLFHKNSLGGELLKSNAKRYAQSIDLRMVNECNFLFFPISGQIAYYLNTSVPIIYHSDATVPLMTDYYWFNIDKAFLKIAISLDRLAARKSIINIRASQWAIDSLIKEFGCDKSRCFVLEFGANIDSKDITPNPVYAGGRLNMLFSGVDWERKGGEIAVETVVLLREKGLDAHLLIVGPRELPQQYKNVDYIEFYGFLDKNIAENYQKYIQLYKKSHMFLLPTKAECAGVVFSESSAFGLPCYTYATGGTTNYVISDYNGFAFPLGSKPEVFADRIFNDIKSGMMKQFHDNALTLYEKKLSWKAWASRFNEILNEHFLMHNTF